MKIFNDLYGILLGCPAGTRRDDCPAKEIDHLSFKEKVRWFDKLDEEEKEKIDDHHTVCSDSRAINRKK